MARASDNLCLGKRGDMNVLLSPPKGGYRAVPCPVELLAVRVARFKFVVRYLKF